MRVFVSYVMADARDATVAGHVAASCRGTGHDVYLAEERPVGEDYDQTITAWLASCDAMVLILGRRTHRHPRVLGEVEAVARRRERTPDHPRLVVVRTVDDPEKGYLLSTHLYGLNLGIWRDADGARPVLEALGAAEAARPRERVEVAHTGGRPWAVALLVVAILAAVLALVTAGRIGDSEVSFDATVSAVALSLMSGGDLVRQPIASSWLGAAGATTVEIDGVPLPSRRGDSFVVHTSAHAPGTLQLQRFVTPPGVRVAVWTSEDELLRWTADPASDKVVVGWASTVPTVVEVREVGRGDVTTHTASVVTLTFRESLADVDIAVTSDAITPVGVLGEVSGIEFARPWTVEAVRGTRAVRESGWISGRMRVEGAEDVRLDDARAVALVGWRGELSELMAEGAQRIRVSGRGPVERIRVGVGPSAYDVVAPLPVALPFGAGIVAFAAVLGSMVLRRRG